MKNYFLFIFVIMPLTLIAQEKISFIDGNENYNEEFQTKFLKRLELLIF